MQTVAYPLAFGHWQVRKDSLVCRMPRKTVSVSAPGALLRAVLQLCDGQLAWKEVAAQLGRRWDGGAIHDFLAHLSREGVLVEAAEALACWSDIAQLPHRPAAGTGLRPPPAEAAQARLLGGTGTRLRELPPAAQAFAALLRQRASRRTFAEAPLGAGVLATILWAAHGVTAAGASSATGPRRTVASASRMHGTRWFVFVLRPQPGEAGTEPLSPGLHEARFHLEGGCSFERLTPGADAAWELLVDPRVLTYASALVLPVHDASLPARRYGNRAPLFGALEAGQSLQNAQLMAEALEAAAVVRGDLRGELALRLVQPYLRPEKGEGARCIALPALVLGARALPRDAELARGERWVSVRAAPRVAGAGSFAFSAGPVRVGTEEFHASGRSSDPRLALVKAEAEAWERHGWGTLGACTEARVGELDQVVDPCRIVAYARHQYAAAGFPLAPFSRRSPYLWRQGMDVQSGREVWLLADCVHALGALPREHRAKAYTNTSTSGVAAWTDAEGALCRGALELLERDAFLRVWVGRRPPILTDPASLPAAARARIDGLAAAGHRVAVAQVADDFVPVYTVFLQAQARAFTAVTAAAAFDPEQALAKALDEAEGRAAHALAAPAEPLASARRVHSLSDIDRFYQSPRFFRNADFLAAGPATESFAPSQHPFCRDWEALKLRLAARALQLIAVDLTPPGAAIRQGRVPLHVVRAVVPGLLPIWFHHGVHPGGMPAFRAARRVAGTRTCAAAHLVHPFT